MLQCSPKDLGLMEYYAVLIGKCVTTSRSIVLSLYSGGIGLRKVILLCLLDPEYEGTTNLQNIEDNVPAHCETPQETSTFKSKAVRTSKSRMSD
jgi:hypothetical protein